MTYERTGRTPQEGFEFNLYAYMGRQHVAGDMYIRFAKLNDADELDDEPLMSSFIYKAKDHSALSVGGVYEIQSKGDRYVVSRTEGGIRYVGELPSKYDEFAAEWAASDSVAASAERIYKREAKGKRDDKALEAMIPLRRAYMRARGVERSILEAQVLRYLRTPVA